MAEDDIEMLFREGVTFIKCENPNCKDFLGGRHSIRISLKDLIRNYITMK